jgi:hypothetical protein
VRRCEPAGRLDAALPQRFIVMSTASRRKLDRAHDAQRVVGLDRVDHPVDP